MTAGEVDKMQAMLERVVHKRARLGLQTITMPRDLY